MNESLNHAIYIDQDQTLNVEDNEVADRVNICDVFKEWELRYKNYHEAQHAMFDDVCEPQ